MESIGLADLLGVEACGAKAHPEPSREIPQEEGFGK